MRAADVAPMNWYDQIAAVLFFCVEPATTPVNRREEGFAAAPETIQAIPALLWYPIGGLTSSLDHIGLKHKLDGIIFCLLSSEIITYLIICLLAGLLAVCVGVCFLFEVLRGLTILDTCVCVQGEMTLLSAEWAVVAGRHLYGLGEG